MQDAHGIHEVEALGAKGKLGGRCLPDCASERGSNEATTCDLNCRRAEIDTLISRTCFDEAKSVRADPAAHLKDIAAMPLRKSRHLWDVRLAQISTPMQVRVRSPLEVPQVRLIPRPE